MIRHAVAADKPALITMARHFLAAVPQPIDAPFSAIAVARTAQAAMQGGLVLVLDIGGVRGALVATLSQLPFADAVVAQELVFWVEPEFRGRWAFRMMQRYEAWAKTKGASLTCLAARDARVQTMFRRCGYQPAELILTKAI